MDIELVRATVLEIVDEAENFEVADCGLEVVAFPVEVTDGFLLDVSGLLTLVELRLAVRVTLALDLIKVEDFLTVVEDRGTDCAKLLMLETGLRLLWLSSSPWSIQVFWSMLSS